MIFLHRVYQCFVRKQDVCEEHFWLGHVTASTVSALSLQAQFFFDPIEHPDLTSIETCSSVL